MISIKYTATVSQYQQFILTSNAFYYFNLKGNHRVTSLNNSEVQR